MMKKVNIYVNGAVRWAAYKKESEYQAWIDNAIANNLWGQPGSYTVEVVDAAAELEQKRQQAEGTKKQDFDAHATSTANPHSVTKAQVGLGSVDNIAAADLRDRSTHTGTQISSTISDFNEAAQDAVGNALLDSADIDFQYPDVNNQITAALTTTGVTPGTYTQVTVDNKGRVTVGNNIGSVVRYKYCTLTSNVNSTNIYANIGDLITADLPAGLYRFNFFGRMQSGATNVGVGVRVTTETAVVSSCVGKWFIDQGANGTAQAFQYNQIDSNTNITSISAPGANNPFNVIGDGVVRITTAGTLAIQIRSETNGTAATLLADSVFILELL
jgi:hypothetical protein